ncbi:unnamed protein product [Didymodactylos carnosus]|uniref:NAD(P)(+)--arginine ADP-ribosyltransferase n=1 Tax=Didymodactylos carnosus TaxID=1234261 RepID=A0A8S2DUI1_9BILA|nr:unnamed protein product [Didymodactylos carnosus]CAF3750226.1 unnamed protein product [Didymodactylos carnosus]
MPQLESIYVVCPNKTKHEHWVEQYKNKIKGVFVETDSIFEQLREDYQQCADDLLTMTAISPNTGSDSNLNKQEVSFMYSQILRDVLIGMEHGDDAKQDMVEYCREQCKDDSYERQVVDEFDREYSYDRAVWWYTRECFLYRMINKALRTQDIDVLYKIRFFIKHLHYQLKKMHSQSTNETMILYRGQAMSSEELDQKVKTNVGGLLSISEFLSTSNNKAAASTFAARNLNRAPLVAVLLEIEIDPTIQAQPFANIQAESYFDIESEVLFSMGAVFRIKSVIQSNDGVWNIILKFTDTEDEQLRALRDLITQEIRERDDLFTLGKLMIEMGEFDRAKTFYELFLKETSAGKNPNSAAPTYKIRRKSYREKRNYRKAWKYYAKALKIKHDREEKVSKILTNIGVVELAQGDYPAALKTYERVLEIFLRWRSPNHSDMTKAYTNIGLIHQAQGDYSEALKMYNKAHEIYLSSVSRNDSDLAMIYSNTGLVLQAQGDHSEALKMFQKTLEKTLDLSYRPLNHPELARTYNNIGLVHQDQGDYSEALKMHEKAYEIYSNSLPPKHPDLVTTYNNIAEVHKATGNYSKAFKMFEKILEISKASHPSNHPDLAMAYNKFGEINQAQGDFSEALQMYNKACEIYSSALLHNHPHLAIVYNNIGLLHNDRGDCFEALKMFEKTLEILKASLPSNHPHLGMLYNNFGEVHQAQGDLSEALQMYNKAFEIYSGSLPSNHHDLAMIYNNFGKLHKTQGDLSEATKMYDKAFEIYSSSLPPNHRDLAMIYNNFGEVCQVQGDYSAALKKFEKAQEIYLSTLSANHPALAPIYNNIGLVHQAQGDFSAALKMFEKAHEIYSSTSSANHPHLITAYNNIERALADQNRVSEARDGRSRSRPGFRFRWLSCTILQSCYRCH